MISSRFTRRRLIAGVCLLGVLGAGVAAGRAAFRSPWIKVHYREMDANRDGTLTRAEFNAAAEKTFACADRDHDGKLTIAEYVHESEPTVLGGYLAFHSREIDRNHDGIITGDEFRAEIQTMFDEADADHDSKITPEEFAKIQPPLFGGKRPRHHGADEPDTRPL